MLMDIRLSKKRHKLGRTLYNFCLFVCFSPEMICLPVKEKPEPCGKEVGEHSVSLVLESDLGSEKDVEELEQN